jgi:hypothetical protein
MIGRCINKFSGKRLTSSGRSKYTGISYVALEVTQEIPLYLSASVSRRQLHLELHESETASCF